MCVASLCDFFFFKQKTAYDMRISDWSSDVCSSDLENADRSLAAQHGGNATDTGSYAGGDAGFGGLAIVQQRQHTSHPWAMDAHVHDPESVERRQGVQRVRRRRTHETIELL